MTNSCLIALAIQLSNERLAHARILEVGSRDVGGSIRPFVEAFGPAQYLGVDIAAGACVDQICDGKDLVATFGQDSFDIVIATSLIEHVRDWQQTVSNIKRVCKPGGTVLISTCAPGFGYHAYPDDFWRFELGDLQAIFADFEVLALEPVPRNLVLIKARKPAGFVEKPLTDYALYSIVANRKVAAINPRDFKSLYFRKMVLRARIMKFLFDCVNFIGATF